MKYMRCRLMIYVRVLFKMVVPNMEEMMMKTSDNAILDNLSSQSVHIT